MLFSDVDNIGINLNALFDNELKGLAVAPTPVNVERGTGGPPANVLVNRVPEGFTPILINLERCSRSELRRFLHNMMCKPTLNKDGRPSKERSLGRCGCELLEFDYQPDFLFNRKRREQDNDEMSMSEYDEDEDEDVSIFEKDDEGFEDEGMLLDDKPSSYKQGSVIVRRGSDTDQEDQDGPVTEGVKIKIKRPPNSFMIYRSERHKELVKEYKGGNKVVSGIIAREWHSMPREQRKKYQDLAAAKKKEHELLYPNYKFMPKRRKA